MPRLDRRFSAVIAALAATSYPAFAHHPGGVGNSGGAGPINTISATTLEQGQTVAGVVIDYTRLKPLSDTTLGNAAAAGIEGVHSLRSISSYSAVFARGITNDLMVSMRLPYIRRTGIRAAEFHEDEGETHLHDHGSSSGFGDVTVLGQYRFLNNAGMQLEAALLAGFIAPTGATNRRDRQGEIFEAEFQPGSGAWSGLLGLALTRRMGAWSFDTNALYVFAGDGTQHTNLGDSFLYNAAISYRLTGLGSSQGAAPVTHRHTGQSHGSAGHTHAGATSQSGPILDLVLEMNGEWHAREQAFGIKEANSGGNTIYVAPGLRLAQDKWSAFVSVGIPVAKDLNGIQSEPELRVRTGLGVSF